MDGAAFYFYFHRARIGADATLMARATPLTLDLIIN
jgi:hypothetical protein